MHYIKLKKHFDNKTKKGINIFLNDKISFKTKLKQAIKYKLIKKKYERRS